MFRNTMFFFIAILLLSTPIAGWADEKIGDCLACQQKETRGIFQAWVNSEHAKKGVDCITCHKNWGKNATAATRENMKKVGAE